MESKPHPVQTETRPVDLKVMGLTKSFAGSPVLQGVDLEIRRGEAVALIGANGAGKSTLLRCCLRLIEPEEGQVHLLDRDLTSLRGARLREVRSLVGFVFQRHNLVPRLSVLSNVVHGAQARGRGPRVWLHGLADKKTREEAMACLRMVGLDHVAERRADQLSGGQSQRVAIARALMQKPKVMVADEPVASLDPQAGEEVMALFLDLIKKQGLTLYFTSHNLRHALRYADRVLGLKSGRIELDAPAHTLNETGLREIYA